jgi:hypothetical protein
VIADPSPTATLAAAIKQHSIASGLAVGSILLGIVVAAGGFALGAALVCLGIGISGFVDRRLPVLLMLLVLPFVAAFDDLALLSVAGGTLNFRLLFTGGIVIAIGPWLLRDRVRPDRIGIGLMGFVALLVILIPLNQVAPARALPEVGRWIAYAMAYLAGRHWFGSSRDFSLLTGALVVAMIVPAVSGVMQLASGTAPASTGFRIAGVYGTSPVSLALAMQMGALALVGGQLLRRRPASRLDWLAIGVLVVLVFVLVETATRLVFVSFVAAWLMVELLHRRPKALPVILLGTALVLITQSSLMDRITSVIPQPTSTPVIAPSGAAPSGAVPSGAVSDQPDDTITTGDPSLRYRLFVWSSMIPEWLESPILGRGTGSFAALFEAKSGHIGIAPHNDYLGVLVETGAVGLLAYLAIQLGVILALARRVIGTAGTGRTIAIIALAEFLALAVLNAINNAMLFLGGQLVLWVIVGSAISQGKSSDRPASQRPSDSRDVSVAERATQAS